MNPSATRDAELIARWIEPNPHKPGPAEARLRGSGVSVWALIGQLQLDDWDVKGVAEDYEVPAEAVSAAVAHYHQHAAAIDARLERNRAVFRK